MSETNTIGLLSDRLDDASRRAALAEIAVTGFAERHGAMDDPAASALRELLKGVERDLLAISREVHPDRFAGTVQPRASLVG
jgi:hypothetical protein